MNLNYDQILSTISNVISLVMLIIILFTLIEMKNQRRSSCKPELAIKKISYFNICFIGPKLKQSLPFIISYLNIESKEFKEQISDICFSTKSISFIERFRCFLEINNIGLAAAKNIKINWHINPKEIIEFMQPVIKSGDIYLSSSSDHFLIKLERFNFEMLYSLSASKSTQIDYIPANINYLNTLKIKIPEIYQCLYLAFIVVAIYSWKDNLDKGQFIYMIEKFPLLKFDVEYNDIEKNKQKQCYKLKIDNVGFHYQDFFKDADFIIPFFDGLIRVIN